MSTRIASLLFAPTRISSNTSLPHDFPAQLPLPSSRIWNWRRPRLQPFASRQWPLVLKEARHRTGYHSLWLWSWRSHRTHRTAAALPTTGMGLDSASRSIHRLGVSDLCLSGHSTESAWKEVVKGGCATSHRPRWMERHSIRLRGIGILLHLLRSVYSLLLHRGQR